tara:strand:+ start:131 stop:415 length:285 start_codon:yes stop_codon:yes gene_type:complete
MIHGFEEDQVEMQNFGASLWRKYAEIAHLLDYLPKRLEEHIRIQEESGGYSSAFGKQCVKDFRDCAGQITMGIYNLKVLAELLNWRVKDWEVIE